MLLGMSPCEGGLACLTNALSAESMTRLFCRDGSVVITGCFQNHAQFGQVRKQSVDAVELGKLITTARNAGVIDLFCGLAQHKIHQ